MRLVIAEKPSVARDIARVLGATGRRDGYLEGNGVRVSWCVGHLVGLQDPVHYDPAWKQWSFQTLPMVPPKFALKARDSAKDQWAIVERLLRAKDVDDVVNACDAGREGELIFRYVYELSGCTRPVQRLWISSLTDAAIQHGWKRLRPGRDFDPLAAAARCRSEADWLVGLNATRAMTCRTRQAGGDALWSIGRVQTPTLAMIVNRDREIEAFVPETFWQVKAQVAATDGGWKATWFRDVREATKKGDDVPKAQRLSTAEAADGVVAASVGRAGVVSKATRREKRERHPLLYDLTALQRRANQRYGLSAARTLEIAQALYEKHKVLTYPRTDARYLTNDQVPELPDVLQAVGKLPPYAGFVSTITSKPLPITKRIVDDAEVGDHHAIIPTSRTPSSGQLSLEEKRIYDLVARRLMAALSPDAIIDLAELVVSVDPDPEVELAEEVPVPLTFRAKGRVLRQAGWREVDPPKKQKDVLLPVIAEGDPITIASAKAEEGQTRPPRPHDDASLLDAMEKAGRALDDAELKRALRGAGIGTPATRAAILTTLMQRDYILRKGKALHGTDKGKALIDTLPAGDLKSAELTGRWEARLSDIAERGGDAEAFMRDVVEHLHGVVASIAEVEVPEAARQRTRPESKSLGNCPACGKPVRQRGKIFSCDTGRDCPFVVFGTMSKRKISARMVKELLVDGRTKLVKGFKSKKGNDFSAGLMVQEDGKVGFWFEEREDRPRRSVTPVGQHCPGCQQGTVIAGRQAWGCSRWREGCTWRLMFEVDGVRLSDAEAVARIRGS